MSSKGIYLSLAQPDELFENLTYPPIILNQLPAKAIEDRAAIDALVTTTYGSEVTSLDAPPSCRCNRLNGSDKLGDLCPQCGSRVEKDFTREIEPSVWIAAPDDIDGLFTPIAFEIFSRRLTSKSWNGLEYLCNTNYKKPDMSNTRGLEIVRRIEKLNMQRGLNETMRNFDLLIELFISLVSTYGNPQLADDTLRFIAENRDKLICRYIPLPSKIAFVLEKTSLGDWTDKPFRHAMECVRIVSNLDREQGDVKRIGNRLTSMMSSLNAYYGEAFGDPFCRKEGWLRQAVYGSRLNFSWRSVITSRTDTHHYEEIQIPYSQACVMFKVHLLNRLIKRHKMSFKKAFGYIEAHSAKRDEFLWNEIMALIKATPGGRGFWSTFTRYPTLSRGSTQALRIVGLTEGASTLSVLAVKTANADKQRLLFHIFSLNGRLIWNNC